MKHAAFFEGLRYCLILHSAFFILHCHAALPRSWQVNAGVGRVVDLPAAFHGEEVELRADFVDPAGKPFTLPDGDWGLYFQTNAMGAAFFGPYPATASSNTVTAVFSPTNDPGAAQITGFLALPGSNYHAAFRLRFLPSPGATPCVLPLPTPSLDFATTTILNPPWPAEIAAEISSLSNTLSQAIARTVQTETDPTVPAWAKAETKPSYTANEVGAATESYVNSGFETATEVAFSEAATAYRNAKTYTDNATNALSSALESAVATNTAAIQALSRYTIVTWIPMEDLGFYLSFEEDAEELGLKIYSVMDSTTMTDGVITGDEDVEVLITCGRNLVADWDIYDIEAGISMENDYEENVAFGSFEEATFDQSTLRYTVKAMFATLPAPGNYNLKIYRRDNDDYPTRPWIIERYPVSVMYE